METVMSKMTKEILIGFLVGLVANLAGSYLYIYFFSEESLEKTIQFSIEQDVLGNIVALGAILNLCAFFIFLKKNKVYRARGVVLATVLAAIIILVSKFL